MSLYSLIKEKRISAIKSKNETLKNILTTLLGEIDRIKDLKGTEDPIIIQCVSKMIKSAEETIQICTPKNLDISESLSIIQTLSEFRPKQRSEQDTRSIVLSVISRLPLNSSIGIYMSEFKLIQNIDMKLASNILKSILSSKNVTSD